MEFKEALFFVIGLLIFTLIIALIKMRNKQRIGYQYTHFTNDFRYKVGVVKFDVEKVFGIVIENVGKKEIKINDIYIEIFTSIRNFFRNYLNHLCIPMITL